MYKFKKNILTKLTKLIFLLALVQAISSLTSCNTCDSPTGGSGKLAFEDRVFFTLYPLNGLIPSVYSINTSGRDMLLHVSNALIFSAPSQNGRIAFLRFDQQIGKNVIMIRNINNSDSMKIDQDNSDYSVAQPILSPDGNKIAFNGGNKRLYVWVSKPDGSSYIDKVSADLFENTIPAFSPDGKKLAFFEGDKNKATLKLRILNADSPDLEISERIFSDNVSEGIYGLELAWATASNKLGFLIANDSISIARVVGLDNIDEEYNLSPHKVISGQFSYSFDYFVFSDVNSKIRVKYINSQEDKQTSITSEQTNAYDLFFKWDSKSNKVIFSKYYAEDGFGNLSTLNLIDFQIVNGLITETKQIILSNNAYKGFWGRKQK